MSPAWLRSCVAHWVSEQGHWLLETPVRVCVHVPQSPVAARVQGAILWFMRGHLATAVVAYPSGKVYGATLVTILAEDRPCKKCLLQTDMTVQHKLNQSARLPCL